MFRGGDEELLGKLNFLSERVRKLEQALGGLSIHHDQLPNLDVGDPHPQYVLKQLYDARGSLLAGKGGPTDPTAPFDVLGALDVGADGSVLYADSTKPLGLRWGNIPVVVGGGGTPSAFGAVQIAVVNESTRVSDADVATMTSAVASQVVNHLAPSWNMLAASVSFYSGGVGTAPAGAWVVHMRDTTDIPGDLGYHANSTPPSAYVFAGTILNGGSGVLTGSFSISQVLSHEVCEMIVDPHVQLYASDFAGHAWLIEVGDVATDSYSLGGVQVANFGLPAWFDPSNFAGPFDFMQSKPGPFQLAPNCYDTRSDLGPGSQVEGTRKWCARHPERAAVFVNPRPNVAHNPHVLVDHPVSGS